MRTTPTRRRCLQTAAGLAAASFVRPGHASAAAPGGHGDWAFGYCLNTATIRGHKLPLDRQIALCIETGYRGIEPWIGDINAYADAGGSVFDLAKRCVDADLNIVSAIGFAPWLADDKAVREKGLEQARREMQLLKTLGGTHIAAPPAGATKEPRIPVDVAAERYHALLKVGEEVGVIPQIEVWGFSANCSTLAESTAVAIASGHKHACVLADVFHMYKGGSPFSGLKLLGRTGVHAFHINDYPEDPPRQAITDGHRVYPTDGVAPLGEILGHLAANHARVWLSLELFNREYYQRDAYDVARTGLEKMKAAVALLG